MKHINTNIETVKEHDKEVHERVKSLQKDFIKGWLGDNQEKFKDAMLEIYEHDKRAWAKIYIEHEKLVIPKQSDINVKHGVSKDFADLLNLGRAVSTEQTEKKVGSFVEFQELEEPKINASDINLKDLKGVVLDADKIEIPRIKKE